MSTPHIRKPLPRRGGNSFYRDTRDFSHLAATFCGAPVTDKDMDIRTAGTKRFRALVQRGEWAICGECLRLALPPSDEVRQFAADVFNTLDKGEA
jgi:hypothetical protein